MKSPNVKDAYVVSTAYETYLASNGAETVDVAESKPYYTEARAEKALSVARGRFPNASLVRVTVGVDAHGIHTINGYPRKVLKSRRLMRRGIWARYGGRCAYCGAEVPYKKFRVDAYIPRLGYDPKNLMPSCPVCYARKKGRTPAQFQAFVEKGFLEARKDPGYAFARRFGLLVETKRRFTFYYLTEEARAAAEAAKARTVQETLEASKKDEEGDKR